MAKIAEAFIDLTVRGGRMAAMQIGGVGGALSRLGRVGSGMGAGLARIGAGLGHIGRAGGAVISTVGRVGMGVAAMGAATGGIGLKAIKSAADFETLRVSMETMMGSTSKANALLDELTTFAAKTPFELAGLGEAAKRLLAFGVSGDQIMPTIGVLGEVAAGTGKDIGELAVIYGQIKSAGRLMGQDLLQLVNTGFNPLQEISQHTGRSMIDLKKDMEKGLISFAMVEESFKRVAGEGGLFGGMMERQSRTINGLWSTLKDEMAASMRAIGIALDEGFDIRGILQSAIANVADFTGWLGVNREAILQNLRYIKDGFLLLKLGWQAGATTIIKATIDLGGNVGMIFATLAENAKVLGHNIWESLTTAFRNVLTFMQNVGHNIVEIVAATIASMKELSLDPFKRMSLRDDEQGFVAPEFREFKKFEFVESDYSKGLGGVIDEKVAEMAEILGGFGQARDPREELEPIERGAKEGAAMAAEAAAEAAKGRDGGKAGGFTGLTDMWTQLQDSLVKQEDRKHKEMLDAAKKGDNAPVVAHLQQIGAQLAQGVVGVAAA